MSKRIFKIEQLDSLRALAAFSVVAFHFLNEFKIGFFHYGWIGVDIFFVISGYLITAILLEQKDSIDNKVLIIKNFIIKRALRLFPIYYLFISFFFILMLTLGLYVWDDGNWYYYYTYTQNILFYLEGMKGIQLNHLWTLAVEEQFYLFWPVLTVFFSNKKLIFISICFILIGLSIKIFNNSEMIRMLTISNFDTLCSGALFALLLKEKKEGAFILINRFKNLLIIISIFGLVITVFYSLPSFVSVICILVLSVSLIVGCFYNFKGVIGIILNNASLKYLGGISYGIYLYHKPLPYFITLVARKTNFNINIYLQFALALGLTLIISYFSFNYIEKRFLNLKEKFDL